MNKVMIIRYDGKPARQFDDGTGKLVPCFIDTEGFPVYIMDIEMAKQLAMVNTDRYRYYRSPSIDVAVKKPNGTTIWEKLHSWTYKKQTVQVGVDGENGEKQYEDRIVWVEDKKDDFVVEASEEFITGKKKFNDKSQEIALLTGENKKLNGVLESQSKLIEEMKTQITTLVNKVNQLENANTPSTGKTKKG